MDYICPKREYHIGDRVSLSDKETYVGNPISWKDLPNFEKKCVLLYDNDPRLINRPWIVVRITSVTFNHVIFDSKYSSSVISREELDDRKHYFLELNEEPRYYATSIDYK